MQIYVYAAVNIYISMILSTCIRRVIVKNGAGLHRTVRQKVAAVGDRLRLAPVLVRTRRGLTDVALRVRHRCIEAPVEGSFSVLHGKKAGI